MIFLRVLKEVAKNVAISFAMFVRLPPGNNWWNAEGIFMKHDPAKFYLNLSKCYNLC
jgi:hypothetical protein